MPQDLRGGRGRHLPGAGVYQGIRKKDAERRPFSLQHVQKLDLLAGGAGEKPVFQSAEEMGQHHLLLRHERIHPGLPEGGGSRVHVTDVHGDVGDVALGHGGGDGGLDQLQRGPGEVHQRQKLVPVRRGDHVLFLQRAADALIKADAFFHIPGVDGDVAQTLVKLLAVHKNASLRAGKRALIFPIIAQMPPEGNGKCKKAKKF